jgi:MATE family multidrug resistance protein
MPPCPSILLQVALDANVIVLSICSLAFTTFPFGISTAASIRVGNLLGAQQPRRARATAVACLAVGVGFMALCGLAILTGRDRVAEIFTPDADIRETVAAVAPVVALFQVRERGKVEGVGGGGGALVFALFQVRAGGLGVKWGRRWGALF